MASAAKHHIAVVGAGPGGLTSAMILAKRGFKVSLFEKKDRVGGRNASVELGPFSFDIGPTFLMMKDILDEVFREAGAQSTDALDFVKLEPMYRLQFEDLELNPTSDHEAMRRQIGDIWPGKEAAFDRFLKTERERFRHLFPCLQRPYHRVGSLLSSDLLAAIPHLALGRNIFSLLMDYFGDEKLALSFTFQSKYLGMSAWDCPALFAILPYIEHHFGIYHVQGGLSRISDAMADVARANGVELHLGTGVRQLQLDGRRVTGLSLDNGQTVAADDVIVNADFGHAMTHLIPPRVLRKYAPPKLARKKFSCSTFMLYLGLDTVYDMPHHTIVFARDYRENVEEVFNHGVLSEDPSYYIRNASITDPGLAPPGKSAVYVLVPVPNQRAGIDWEQEAPRYRRRILESIGRRTAMTDIEDHIETERIITPVDWETDYDVHLGATFNLAHNIGQMIYLRPRNRFEELEHCYLAGGGTHPGSGLPTIYESGRITANLISRYYNIEFNTSRLQI